MNRRLAPWILLLALSPWTARAEVSVDRPVSGGVAPYFEVGATGPWGRVRTDLPPGDVLNEMGDGSGDGWPVVLANTGAGRVEAVWASGGEDREIFRSFHDGSSWSAPENLSAAVGIDNLPTAVTDEAGNVFVAWERERNGRHGVHFTAISPVDGQVASAKLTPRFKRGRRPVSASHDSFIWVASEEVEAATSSAYLSVVLDRIDVLRDAVGHVVDGGEDTIDVARRCSIQTHQASNSSSTAIKLHVEAGHIWMDWVDDTGSVGWVQRLDGAWSDPQYEGFDAVSGDAPARATVRDIVLGL